MILPPNTNRQIEKLHRDHSLDHFDCGSDELNHFLKQNALQTQQSDGAATYVGIADGVVIGFYTIVVGTVERERAPSRISKGLGRYPVPIMIIARLATDKNWQGQGVGSALLKDAMLRTINAAEIAGIRAIVVHAKNEDVAKFYKRFTFVPSPTDPLHLFIPLKDVRSIIEGHR